MAESRHQIKANMCSTVITQARHLRKQGWCQSDSKCLHLVSRAIRVCSQPSYDLTFPQVAVANRKIGEAKGRQRCKR